MPSLEVVRLWSVVMKNVISILMLSAVALAFIFMLTWAVKSDHKKQQEPAEFVFVRSQHAFDSGTYDVGFYRDRRTGACFMSYNGQVSQVTEEHCHAD
jgi:hypothetical protein